MRIAIGGIMHESNTFSTKPTDRAAFGVQRGEEILRVWREAHHEVTGFLFGAEKFGFDPYPMLFAGATPGGTVTDEAFEELVGELIERLQSAPDMDGLLLALHGAMAVESFPDGDGEVLRRLREAFGSAFPIVVTHDFHANISERLVKDSTALVVYKTNPHVDQRERGLHAAELLVRTIRGEIKPTQALAKPPMLFNILYQNTSKEPLKSIMDAAREIEGWRKVLAANVAAGYQYADVYEMGPSAVVVTDDDPRLAQNAAQRLSDMLWEVREHLVIDLPDAANAVRMAVRESATQKPTVLVDMGDNIGGGSAGDSTLILSELLKQEAEGWVCVVADPEAVQECIKTGVGQSITLNVGGKTDPLHGEPVEIHGRIRNVHDGRYEETEPRHGGKRYHDQGITAVVEVDVRPHIRQLEKQLADLRKENKKTAMQWLGEADWSHPSETALDRVVRRIAMILQAEGCAFMLPDAESGELSVRPLTLGFDDEELPLLARVMQTISQEALRDGRPVLVDNAMEDARLPKEDTALLNIRNVLTIPLVFEGSSIGKVGALHVFNKRFGGNFTPEDARLLTILGRQVAYFIATAQSQNQLSAEERLKLVKHVITETKETDRGFFTDKEDTEDTRMGIPRHLFPPLGPAFLVLTSKREPPFSLEQLRSLGIKPEKQRILVVKAAIAFRAAYQPIAGRIIEVNTPGLTCIDPKRFNYRRVRRPLIGLD